jgi:hypothetical protein
VHRRFAARCSRADLRERISTPESFLELVRELRLAAASRALLSAPPYPLPVLCLDQGEEFFALDAGPETEKCLRLVRAAIDGDEALLLVTIRTDAYGLMQGAKMLDRVEQIPISLGPMPSGEIARVIRKPAEILRRLAGPSAPVFDAAIVERLQAKSRERGRAPTVGLRAGTVGARAGTTDGLNELDRTGGVARPQVGGGRAGRCRSRPRSNRAASHFQPVHRVSRADRSQQNRRIARQSEMPIQLLPLCAHSRGADTWSQARWRDGCHGREGNTRSGT